MTNKEDLLRTIDTLRELIEQNHFSEPQMQDISETANAYVRDEWDIDTDMVKYLFTGFWMHKMCGADRPDDESELGGPFKPSAKSMKRDAKTQK